MAAADLPVSALSRSGLNVNATAFQPASAPAQTLQQEDALPEAARIIKEAKLRLTVSRHFPSKDPDWDPDWLQEMDLLHNRVRKWSRILHSVRKWSGSVGRKQYSGASSAGAAVGAAAMPTHGFWKEKRLVEDTELRNLVAAGKEVRNKNRRARAVAICDDNLSSAQLALARLVLSSDRLPERLGEPGQPSGGCDAGGCDTAFRCSGVGGCDCVVCCLDL
jgi:hypothetical protein|uniref:Uncharacterized protein n=1 Tax=Emiliania huxleyi TaxID=2903 RepID=A0A6U8NNV6_EMIHU|mmetsp:Transcript_27171/g.79348  ORF Transcript_27171/g.79348 Transcript_27171/m.79348 type:complete len:220 (+) Transcript_27171:52-711(+)